VGYLPAPCWWCPPNPSDSRRPLKYAPSGLNAGVQAIVVVLAAAAGIAIDNDRLCERTRGDLGSAPSTNEEAHDGGQAFTTTVGPQLCAIVDGSTSSAPASPSGL
jgi:hypothetical protein